MFKETLMEAFPMLLPFLAELDLSCIYLSPNWAFLFDLSKDCPGSRLGSPFGPYMSTLWLSRLFRPNLPPLVII